MFKTDSKVLAVCYAYVLYQNRWTVILDSNNIEAILDSCCSTFKQMIYKGRGVHNIGGIYNLKIYILLITVVKLIS